MNSQGRTRTSGTWLFAAGSAVLLGACVCRNSLVSRDRSPTQAREAVVFERNCGAATGMTVHVSIVDAGASPPTSVGNAFRVKDTSSTTPTSTIRNVSVRWRTDADIVISYDERAAVVFQRSRIEGVRITYEALPAAP